MSDSVVAAHIIQAYRETEYTVLDTTPFTLIIGQPCPPLAQAHRRHKTDCSCFITACNPHSQQLPPPANASRQQALADELTRRSLHFMAGVGQHPDNNWPAEDSFLVFGLALEAARVLGTHLGQNAIVWAGRDATPQLILLH